MTRLKIDKFIMEVKYLDGIFDVTYRKFLYAIDHIEYHPSFQDKAEPVRKRRSTILDQTGYYKPYDHVLTPHEEELLHKLLYALKKINSPLLGKIIRMKRFSIINWFLGWGIYSNSRSIKKIKKNLCILQDQNILQDKQIKELAKHLNLTMAHVNRHETMLYELDSKLTILNKTLQNIMVEISYFQYENNLMDNMQMHINHIYTAIYALKEDIDSLYGYMRVLSTQQLNPLIMPPDILREVLNQVREGIRSNARLTLSENPLENIWTYYNIIKVTPILLDDFLMVILTVPLIDSSLNVNLYRIHNLPILHPMLEIQVEYELEGKYFTTHMHGMYATIPKVTDIKLCMMMQGHLCMFDEPLYPVDKLNWCIYALFTNDLDKMKNCRVKTSVQNTNMAYSLDGYLWAISSLVTEKLQTRCMQQTLVVTIHPPL